MQQHNHVLIVSMLSTSWNGYIKQTDIHLKPSVQPYHLILRSPLLICYQMTDQRVGKWKHSNWQMSETAVTRQTLVNEIITAPPYLKIIQQNERMGTEQYLVFSSITLQLNRSRILSFCHPRWKSKLVLFGVSPQVILHAEKESSGDVGDSQPLWPSHWMDLGCSHPEGQTPQKPAMWVDSKTTSCTFWYPLNLKTSLHLA